MTFRWGWLFIAVACTGALAACGGRVRRGIVDASPGVDGASDGGVDAFTPSPDASCRDRDGDGICDDEDACPTIPSATSGDLDADGVPDVCDPDVDGDGVFPPADCDDLDANIGPDVPERCGNSVDENCDGTVGTEAYYRLPVEISLPEDLNDGIVHIVLDDPDVLAHLGSGDSLRAYPVKVGDPWQVPYTGWPLYMEQASDTRVAAWLRVTLPTGSSTVHLYYGRDAASVSAPRAVFDAFETFDDESVLADWTLESNRMSSASQGMDEGTFLSPPRSLRAQLSYRGSCLSNLYAQSAKTLTLDAGTWMFAYFAQANSCSGCTISHRILMDGAVIGTHGGAGGALVPRRAQATVSAGDHTLAVGMYTTAICSGGFPAWTDDLGYGRSTDPEPSVVVDASLEEEVCR